MTGLGFVAALAVGVLLIGSGVGKYLTGRFIRDLANYQVLPRAAVPTAARVIPGVEIVVGVAMLAFPSAAIPSITAAALFAGYAGAVTVNLLRGRRIACGCHGSERAISWELAIEDVGWACVSLLTLAQTHTVVAVFAGRSDEVSVGQAASLAGCLALVALFVRLAGSARELARGTERVARLAELRSEYL